jgi:hypothetical protein
MARATALFASAGPRLVAHPTRGPFSVLEAERA